MIAPVRARHRAVRSSEDMTAAEHPRSIRSFVTRGGRITAAQERALSCLWPKYGVAFGTQVLDTQALFGRDAPCTIEIGFGNGENLLSPAGAFAPRPAERVPTRFERRGERLGHEVWDLAFRRT